VASGAGEAVVRRDSPMGLMGLLYGMGRPIDTPRYHYLRGPVLPKNNYEKMNARK
jgi:hypothetical protein